jgi:hypothetical protein
MEVIRRLYYPVGSHDLDGNNGFELDSGLGVISPTLVLLLKLLGCFVCSQPSSTGDQISHAEAVHQTRLLQGKSNSVNQKSISEVRQSLYR